MRNGKIVGEQESIIYPTGYTPIDQRGESYGTAIDDRSRFQELQGHRYYVKYPQPLTGEDKAIADEIAAAEKRIQDAKRSELLGKMTADEKHVFILREEQQAREAAADKAAADNAKAQAWQEKHGAKVDELKALRQEMTTSGNGWKVSEVLAVDDAIKQLSAVDSDESFGQKLYDAVVINFDTRQDAIETALRAEIMGLQNRADALQRRMPRQPVETESEFDRLLRESLETTKAIESARASGDDVTAERLLAESKARREARKAAKAAG